MFSVKEGPFYEPYFQCVTYDVSTESERVYNIINFITLFVIPLLGLIASYLSIYCTLSRSQREIRSVDKITIAMTHDQNRQRSMKRAMVKSRWIAVVIVCAYLVSWLPYYITMLVYFLSPGQWYDSKWMDWIFFFGMGNSVVNPAIYGMFQLWKPKRRKQWCFRHREGSTQMTHFTTQDSFRRHGAGAASLAPPHTTAHAVSEGGVSGVTVGGRVSPTPSCPNSAPASPVPLTLSAIPDVRRRTMMTPTDDAETTLVVLGSNGAATTAALSAPPPRVVVSCRVASKTTGVFSWRVKFLRKYRALRAHSSSHQTHI
ncbi:hypothetical protein ONE63_006467 [Megalurothrips usitatus]|uniref:G-protein coupled receptors family 1 profile domain-containing protein n=1 Tax=Megalurothrips usitatus TaxID=439358 RepID=A0AAV7XTI3_9NEOP|nr:hypothetical protein ONE63_006467 [Megalurothrips usitatus]